MSKKISILLLLISLVTLSSCLKNEETYCNPPVVNIPEEEKTILDDFIFSNKIDADLHQSGFYYKISSEGDGTSPVYCSDIRVNYEGMLSDFATFDQGNDISFNLLDLIPGWALGIPLIKKNGIITLYLPPSMAYGSTGIPNKIPGNAITIFKIELLEVKK